MNSLENKLSKMITEKFGKVIENVDGIAACWMSLLAILLVVALFCGLVVYFIWAMAFVSTFLWLWFVVPVFGVAPLTLLQAYGLATLVTFWTHQHITDKVKDERKTSEIAAEIIGLFARPWVTLLIGYIVYRLM